MHYVFSSDFELGQVFYNNYSQPIVHSLNMIYSWERSQPNCIIRPIHVAAICWCR